MYQEKSIDANGVHINFIEASTSGKPLVLLHGAGSEWQSFLPLLPALAQDCHVYALDLRGHGGSGRVRERYRLSDYAGDVEYFLEKKIPEPAIIYGHSLGAQVAMAVAVHSPGWVRGLVLGDPPYYFHNLKTKDSVWYEPFVELHHVLSTYRSAQQMEEYMTGKYPNMDAGRRKARAETMSHIDPEVIATIMEDRLLVDYDVDALPRQIPCPVLLIQGNPELGSALREEDASYLAERIPYCELLRMQAVGHGLPTGEALTRVEGFLWGI